MYIHNPEYKYHYTYIKDNYFWWAPCTPWPSWRAGPASSSACVAPSSRYLYNHIKSGAPLWICLSVCMYDRHTFFTLKFCNLYILQILDILNKKIRIFSSIFCQIFFSYINLDFLHFHFESAKLYISLPSYTL